MSISIKNVTKIYSQQKAVDNISIEVKSGEIIGFLGPNGAGKSTTMKMITCFLPQTSGEIFVCGHNVLEDPIAVKNKVGYLPEHNPLYLDMYVKEYLHFIAGLHKLSNKKQKVADIIKAVGLTKEENKKIGQLSKGYRQRVGLAQAMIHDPEVLILDEPTSGLDPNQLVEIRELIRKFGQEKTVILSTHIMQEVEAICNRVIIINEGKIVADAPVSEIKNKVVIDKVIKVEFDQKPDVEEIKKLKEIKKIKSINDNTLLIAFESSDDFRITISKFAQNNNLLILSMQLEESNLESVFKELTK